MSGDNNMAREHRGPITKFPGDGLRHARRFMTGHNEKGLGVFIGDDDGDHHRILCDGDGVANIIYTTVGDQVDMNNDVDIKFARENEPHVHVPHGSCARLIDFAPGIESPMHRAMSLDYGVVIEGEFDFILDSGEVKRMLPGDCSVNRGANHKWRNASKDRYGRMLFILLDVKPLVVNGKVLEEDMGDLAKDYADIPKRES